MYEDSEKTIKDKPTQPENPQSSENTSEKRWKPGEVILGQYEVISELGQGGMGVVYRCLDKTGGTEVAVKSLPPELSHNPEEMREVRENYNLVSKLIHQNIAACKTLAQDTATGDYYLVMEYVEGEELKAWMRRKRKEGTMTLASALPVLKQVAAALDFAHGQKIMHRDIKPGNIMVKKDGSVKVLDFGLAAQIRTSLSHVSMAYSGQSGTRQYKSPEQWKGKPQGGETDQYALAVTAYEMLSGQVPFDDDDPMVMRTAVLNEAPDPINGITESANKALSIGLAKLPKERYATCMDFVTALGGGKVKPQGGVATGGKMDKRVVAGAAVLVAAVLILCVLIPFINKGNDSGAGKLSAEPPVVNNGSEPVVTTAVPTNSVAVEPVVEPKKDAPKPQPVVAVDSQALKQETLALQSRMDRVRKVFAEGNIDRGQTFGQHLDEFADQSGAGDRAMEKDDFQTAKACYATADKAREWIEKNLPLRKEAAAKLAAVKKALQAADGQDAKRRAIAPYGQAAKSLENGGKLFESGRFDAATAAFATALQGFNAATETARKAHLAELVEAATLAANAGELKNWETVQKLAEEMKPLDEKVAAEWKEKANLHLTPCISIKATVDGREVEATLAGTNEKTPLAGKDLPVGKILGGQLVYRQGDDDYAGSFETTVDWRGLKEITVELKKVTFKGIVTLPRNVSLEMVKIKAGSFTMGSPAGELGRYDSETQHRVTLTRDYWLGKYEVTQGQWKAIMGGNPSKFSKGDNYPVEMVSWNDAMEFCKKLTERERSEGRLPVGYEFTLPTEAQWEYACRAGTTTALNNGRNITDEKCNCDNLNEVGWYDYHGNSSSTQPVGRKRANAWGLYDMHGNVLEWCRDWYGYYPSGSVMDPAGPSSGSCRVLRGGGWSYSARYCRSAGRNSLVPSGRYSYYGFRVALAPVQ